MFKKIFDPYSERNVLSLVSHEAALAYCVMCAHADCSGTFKGTWILTLVLDVDLHKARALASELADAGLIDIGEEELPVAELSCGFVMGRFPVYAIRDFELPDTVSRLSAKAWDEVRRQVFERDDWTCQYCDERGGALECDHVTPISAGGTNEMGNLVTSCRACNREKRAKLISEWRRESVKPPA